MMALRLAHRQLPWRRDSPPLRRRSSWLAAGCVAAAWIAIPAVALADDCSAWTLGEVPSCLLLGALLPPFLVAAAILAAASWMGSHTSPSQPTEPAAPPSPALVPNTDNVEGQNRAYDPGGSNMGGGFGI